MANSLGRPAFAVDRLYRADSSKHFDGDRKKLVWHPRAQGLLLNVNGNSGRPGIHKGVYTSSPIRAVFSFQELVPSWNIRINEQFQGYRVCIRVGNNGRKWSTWFYFGSGGISHLSRSCRNTIDSTLWGRVNIDYLSLHRPAEWFQYRIELESTGPLPDSWRGQVALQRFFVSYSNISQDPELHATYSVPVGLPRVSCEVMHKIPYRSQLSVSVKNLRGQICCPTCVAMVLEKHGVDKPTLQVAQEAYDPEHKIYGVWPRASQAAANNGMEAWIQRFRTHEDVRALLLSGQPVMASIRVILGELPSSSYKKSNGHLILLCGFRKNGDYIVNDPYCSGPKGAEIYYPAHEIEKVWLDKGGVGIIIRKPLSVKG